MQNNLSRVRIRPRAENEDYIAHFGIKGQKWGQRRYQNEDGTLTEEGKRRYADKPESETWKKSDADRLTDDELRRRNTRLQAEKQYRDLKTTNAEREKSKFKSALTKALVLTPVLAIAGTFGKKYIDRGAKFIAAFAKKKAAPYRLAGMIKNTLKKYPNIPDQMAPLKEILGKHVGRLI